MRTFEVNWRQAAGEALLIFFGVTVALAGQAAWEARVERVAVRQQIDGLLDELHANREGLRGFEEFHTGEARRAANVVRLIGEPPSAALDDSLVAAAWGLVSHNYFVPATSAMSNLLGAGEFSLLRDTDLRLKVTTYAQTVESFNSFAADLSNFQTRELRPVLGRVLPLAERRMVDLMDQADVRMPESGFQADAARLRTVEFENLAVFRAAYEADLQDAVRGLVEEVEGLIAALEAYR